MKVVFRVDASLEMGTGHVMRCLTLAQELKKPDIEFICREHVGNLINYIKTQGYKVNILPQGKGGYECSNQLPHSRWLGVSQQEDARECKKILKISKPDWLIVDHYSIDIEWEKALINNYQKLMVIDDIADRKHECDMLLDQNYGSVVEKYLGLVPKNSRVLAGSKYALLRKEFCQLRKESLQRRKQPKFKELLITLGGVDSKNFTAKILQKLKLCSLPSDLTITVVMGATAPHIKMVKALTKEFMCKVHLVVDVKNMARLMTNSDLAIGAAGATTWERCCLALPTIQIVIADNQKMIAEKLNEITAIKQLEELDMLPDLLDTLSNWQVLVSQKSALVCDGLGAGRVVANLEEFEK